MKMTPVNALTHQVRARPKSTAFVFHERVWTYERLASDAERRAVSDRVTASLFI